MSDSQSFAASMLLHNELQTLQVTAVGCSCLVNVSSS